MASIRVHVWGKRWIRWTGLNLLREETALAALHLLAHVEGAAFYSINILFLHLEPTSAHGQAGGALNPLVVDELHRLSPNGRYRVTAEMVCNGCSGSCAIDEFALRTAVQLGIFRWARDTRNMGSADMSMELSSMLHTTQLCQRVMICAGKERLADAIVNVRLAY